jgi:hypothetical protein
VTTLTGVRVADIVRKRLLKVIMMPSHERQGTAIE